MRSVTKRSVFAPAVRAPAPAPAPTLSRLTARSHPLSGEEVLPSEQGHRAVRLRGVPCRPAERPGPSLVFQVGALEEDGAPVGRVRPGAEHKADLKRPISYRLSQRGPAGRVVTVPESARGCGHSVPHPGTHCRGRDRAHSPGGVGTETNKNRSAARSDMPSCYRNSTRSKFLATCTTTSDPS